MRVYEFSKKSGLSNKELVKLLQDNGFDVASHMSVLPAEALTFLENMHKKPEKPAVAVEERPEPEKQIKETIKVEEVKEVKKIEKVEERVIGIQLAVVPMTVAEFAQRAHKPLADVIMTLLKKGIVASKNQMISAETVAALAQQYELKIAQQTTVQEKQAVGRFKSVAGADLQERLPIVVVIGHVDHGKTTLLDYIRKTRVAAREKGGITQHLGAYEARIKQGSMVFLDTPGHEAFTLMRTRGIKVADIAIVVVAADDGVMPQTVEAIKAAQQAGVTIIVALNKIDKVAAPQIERVKQSLTQYGLVPEEWGGDTVIMPISAKLGQGVDELLEVVWLQAQLMELVANHKVPAKGFVLESQFEKGLGAVATVICQQGTLHVGDYFVAGSVQGKVSTLVDSFGQRIKEVKPSVPVRVAGFDQLPQAGDAFEVVSLEEYKKARQTVSAPLKMRSSSAASSEHVLNLLVKADNVSSLEAILGALSKLSGKAFKEFQVIHSAVGSMTESDITLAADTKSLIYGLHVKVEPNAALLAQKLGVTIKLFDIIYKMMEDLALVAEQGRPAKKVVKKTGEAVVLKVFDIKSLGVIAGAQVKSGVCSKSGNVVVWRGKYKVGEGPIKSLQRDKKSVKEVHAGFECAFMVDGFAEWQVDDRVECYLEMNE